MKDYLKKNFFSFLVGALIGIPLALYANTHRTPHEPWYLELKPEPDIVTVEIVQEFNETEKEEVMQDIRETSYSDLYEEMYYDSLELLACCVEAEAGNQGLIGKQLVVDVILNRVDDPDFPACITDVIMQKNQFSVVSDGRIETVTPTEETYEAIRREFEHRLNYEIIFFTAEGFSKYGEPWQRVGDHYFSTKKKG